MLMFENATDFLIIFKSVYTSMFCYCHRRTREKIYHKMI